MRILVLNYRDRTHPLAGGAEVHLHKIFGYLAELGHEITLFTTNYKIYEPVNAANQTSTAEDFNRKNSARQPQKSKFAPEREFIDKIEVIRHGGDLMFQFNVFSKVPKLIKEKKIEAVVEDLNKLPLFSPLFTKLPKLIQIHHLWRFSIFREASFPVALAVYLSERIIPLFYKKCNFAAVSPSAKKELCELGIEKDRISVIYNGTDSDLLEAERIRDKTAIVRRNVELAATGGVELAAGEATELVEEKTAVPTAGKMRKFEENAGFFLFLGRLRKYKGVWVALKAFKLFVEKHHFTVGKKSALTSHSSDQSYNEEGAATPKLLFAGTGPEEVKLRNAVKKWGLESKVEFLGMVGKDEKRELLRNAIALIQPSFKEGWGLTVIEAAAVGTTSIASNVSGLCDSVKNGETGLLFKAGDAADCAQKMNEIFHNSALRNNLESAARNYAASFSWETAAKETLSLLQKETHPINIASLSRGFSK